MINHRSFNLRSPQQRGRLFKAQRSNLELRISRSFTNEEGEGYGRKQSVDSTYSRMNAVASRIRKLSRAMASATGTPFGSRSGSLASSSAAAALGDGDADDADADSRHSAHSTSAPSITVTPSSYRINHSPANTPKISVTSLASADGADGGNGGARSNKKLSSDFAELLSKSSSVVENSAGVSVGPTQQRETLILYRRQRRPGITFQNMTIKRPRGRKDSVA